MESNVKYTRIKQKIDSSNNWSKNNPILLEGEIGIESDTGIIKVGDGNNNYNNLSVVNDITYLPYLFKYQNDFEIMSKKAFQKQGASFITSDSNIDVLISQKTRLFKINLPPDAVTLSLETDEDNNQQYLQATLDIEKCPEFLDMLNATITNSIIVDFTCIIYSDQTDGGTKKDCELNKNLPSFVINNICKVKVKTFYNTEEEINIEKYSVSSAYFEIFPTIDIIGKSQINFIYTQGYSAVVVGLSDLVTQTDLTNIKNKALSYISCDTTDPNWLQPYKEELPFPKTKQISGRVQAVIKITNNDGIFSSSKTTVSLGIPYDLWSVNPNQIEIHCDNNFLFPTDCVLGTTDGKTLCVYLYTSEQIIKFWNSNLNYYRTKLSLPENGKTQSTIIRITSAVWNIPEYDNSDFIYVQDGISYNLKTQNSICDNLTSTSITKSLSANQGKILKDLIDSKAEVSHATTADKLKTSRKISLTTGATAAGYFDGSSDLSLRVTNLANDYMNWSPYDQKAKSSSILDDALLSDTTNVFGFFPSECISIEYSTDGGITWTDYGWTDEQKRIFVTPEAQKVIGDYRLKIGKEILPTTIDHKVRITFSADIENKKILYCYLRKLKFKFSTKGGVGSTVDYYYQTYAGAATDSWILSTSSTLLGWPAWYTINCSRAFGSTKTDPTTDTSTNVRKIRLEFSITGLNTNTSYDNKLQIYGIYGLSDNIYWFNSTYIEPCWINNHKPYRLDINKKAYFFGDIQANLDGIANYANIATKAEQDSEGNIIKDTYLKKSELPNNNTISSIIEKNSCQIPIGYIYLSTSVDGKYTYYKSFDKTKAYAIYKDSNGNNITTELQFQIDGVSINTINDIDINKNGECIIFSTRLTSSSSIEWYFVKYQISEITPVYKTTITHNFISQDVHNIGINSDGFILLTKFYLYYYTFSTSQWKQFQNGDSNNLLVNTVISQDRNKAIHVYAEKETNSQVFSGIDRNFVYKILTFGETSINSLSYTITGGAEIQDIQLSNNGYLLTIHGDMTNSGEYPYRLYIHNTNTGTQVLTNFYNGEKFILRGNASDPNHIFLLTQEKSYYPEWYISELTQGNLYTERKLQKVQDFEVLDNGNIQLLII